MTAPGSWSVGALERWRRGFCPNAPAPHCPNAQLPFTGRNVLSMDFSHTLLETCLTEHEDAQWVTSLPGAGAVIACKIISRFGDDRDRFSSYEDVQALSGAAPVTVQSGKYRNVHFRSACSKPFRDTMHTLAFCSIKESHWAKAYYRKKREEGKTHNHAIRCLAFIWVKIIYTLWKKRELYSEEKRLASIGRHALYNN